MEERTNAKEEPRTADESGIVELTPEMVLTDQSQVQIIELTNTVDSPETESSHVPSVEQPIEAAAPPEHVDKAPAPPSEPSDIEQQVDAAFEAAQIETAERMKTEAQQDQLLEQLSDMTNKVDDAVRKASDTDMEAREQVPSAEKSVEPAQTDETEISDQAQPQPIDEPEFDEAQLALDVALIDEAMAPADEQPEADDEIIELTDVVDPVEIDPEAYAAPVTLETDQEDEELLELKDIVDTPKRQAAEPVVPTDFELAGDQDDILELTDIVDPAEVTAEPRPESEPAAAPSEAIQTDDEEIIELTDIVDPAVLETLDQTVLTAPQADSDDEAIIELTDIVDPALFIAESRKEPPSGQMDPAGDDIIELTDIVDPAELERSEIPLQPISPGSDDEVLRLTDVLDQPQKKSPSAADDEPSA